MISAFQGPSEKLLLEQACIHKIDKIKPTRSLKVRRVAGCLKFFSKKWELITKSRFVLNCIKGYKIRFTSQSFQVIIPKAPLVQGSQTLDEVRGAINNLLNLGAIRPCAPEEPQFVSSYFLIPKADETFRFVLNLKKLNKFILTKHFKLEDGRTAEKLISKNDFLAKIDLENAYFLIPIDEGASS